VHKNPSVIKTNDKLKIIKNSFKMPCTLYLDKGQYFEIRMFDFPHKGNKSQNNRTFPQINLFVTFYYICANLRFESEAIKGHQLINHELR
jgi:hypothetical protein